MKSVAVLVALAAACGGSQNTGPVPGAREASARHYHVSVAGAHDALVEVLKQKYGVIVSDYGSSLAARFVCRSGHGDTCESYQHSEEPTGGQDPLWAGPTAAAGYANTTSGGNGRYAFQVYAAIVGTDGDVQIQLSGHVKDRDGHDLDVGAPGAPAWMPHEVDEIRVAVDRELSARADR